jgi:hypothetical protein
MGGGVGKMSGMVQAGEACPGGRGGEKARRILIATRRAKGGRGEETDDGKDVDYNWRVWSRFEAQDERWRERERERERTSWIIIGDVRHLRYEYITSK